MIRFAESSFAKTSRFALAAMTAVAALTLASVASAARADTLVSDPTLVSDRALTVRSGVVAMSLADAAMPVAIAVSTTLDDQPALLPASSSVTKPETLTAMASMRTEPVRGVGYTGVTSYERRARFYRDPFPIILGIGF